MRKLLSFSLYVFIAFISNILIGCNNSTPYSEIPEKSYEEFYEDLKNTTIEMEVVIKDKRATFLYTNDDSYFVSTIKYENAQEYGFIYENETNILYSLDKGKVSSEITDDLSKEQIKKIFESANYFFYLRLDIKKFIFQETVTIANRECNKYRYEDTQTNTIYNIYLDHETSLCLKLVMSKNENIELFFETKKYINEPQISNYQSMVYSYKEQNSQKDK